MLKVVLPTITFEDKVSSICTEQKKLRIYIYCNNKSDIKALL